MKPHRIPTIYRNLQANCITIAPQHPKYSLLWLHGLDDSPENYLPYFTHYHSPVYAGVRVRLLQAPLRTITMNANSKANAWFDVRSNQHFVGEERTMYSFEDIAESIESIQGSFREEVEEVRQADPTSPINPIHKVFIGGFGQGGAMSLAYAMQASQPPAGVISLSGYYIPSLPMKNAKKFPMLLMHGEQDKIVPEINARKSYEKLMAASSYLTDYRVMQKLDHSLSIEQLLDMKKWIKETYGVIEKIYTGKKQATRTEEQQN